MWRCSRRWCGVLVGMCLALAIAPAASARAPKIPKFTLVQAKITVATIGHLHAQASTTCDSHPCADGEEFLNGSFNVNFSSDVVWPFVPLQLSGSPLPGIPSQEGYNSNSDHVG